MTYNNRIISQCATCQCQHWEAGRERGRKSKKTTAPPQQAWTVFVCVQSGASVRVVNQLLTEMDGLESRRQVFIMAATNRPGMETYYHNSTPQGAAWPWKPRLWSSWFTVCVLMFKLKELGRALCTAVRVHHFELLLFFSMFKQCCCFH